MLAGFAAAYMSTMATQLNWGASYLINDFYKRFLAKDKTEKHYVNVSRGATIVLFLAALIVSRNMTSVADAWRFLIALGAGTGLVLILRWYWWRINAWSEISAMIASLIVSLMAPQFVRGMFSEGDPRIDSVVLVITVAASLLVWVTVTMLTKPEDPRILEAFYRRVRPGGPGWATISTRLGYGREAIPGGALAWTNWIAGVIAVYASLFGIGKVLFGEYGTGFGLLALAVVAFAWIARSFRMEEAPPSDDVGGATVPVAAD
jgi:Na+/proline symporter